MKCDEIFSYAGWQLPPVQLPETQMPEQASALELPVALAPWLLCPGSLTQKLKAFQPGFRLQLLSEQTIALPKALAKRWQTTIGMQRQVILYLGEQPCVFGQSFLPDHTLQALTPLADLGEQPLGHYIFQQADLVRGEIEVACFAAGLQLPALGEQPEVWGRRSFFALQQHELLVQEVFLAGLFKQ
ncbi:chorismate--pyruvate lyase family protein [Rheinheimera sp. SA_1]|uniref:chorismate--pyruvate lyase family protein n=1 Tax=Rheinheimera sp. SA_1 TaxID=1827365 RepID=UPI0018D3958B|nr:chorismate lyase [Rheinheimera sp. SA_1]